MQKAVKERKDRRFRILLLTNRDSDNVGDQIIEASDIGLISAVMKNLNVDSDEYEISSRAAAIVTQDYLAKRSPELLDPARQAIQNCDVVIFGGAPVFNYLYQNFYERTAVTLEIAEEYKKPVIFSAVGVEQYGEKNAKCQRLKKTLNFDCVKQITTRDDFSLLQKYIDKEDIVVKKVADPAVFSAQIFDKYRSVQKNSSKKKIGLFVLRANGFVDNKIDFSRYEAAEFWKKLSNELDDRGYDYELLTSGHFGDEAYLDFLIRNYGVDAKKCVFNMNTPENLIKKISSYDAVVTCRLHPSIISFSLDVPSIGIVWNSKVRNFYKNIGYEDRLVEINQGINVDEVIDKIENAISSGVKKNESFLLSVYTTLFNSLKDILCPGSDELVPYTYSELLRNIPPYKGTSDKEKAEKLRRKFRRAYKTYNGLFDKNRAGAEQIKQLKEENKQLKEQIRELQQKSALYSVAKKVSQVLKRK